MYTYIDGRGANFLFMYINKGKFGGKQILKENTIKLMLEFQDIIELYRERMDPRNKINAIDATGPEILVSKNRIFINTTRNRNCFEILEKNEKNWTGT